MSDTTALQLSCVEAPIVFDTGEAAESALRFVAGAYEAEGFFVRVDANWFTAASASDAQCGYLRTWNPAEGLCPKHGTPLTRGDTLADGSAVRWCDRCADEQGPDDYTGEDDLTERAIENRWAGMDDEDGRR